MIYFKRTLKISLDTSNSRRQNTFDDNRIIPKIIIHKQNPKSIKRHMMSTTCRSNSYKHLNLGDIKKVVLSMTLYLQENKNNVYAAARDFRNKNKEIDKYEKITDLGYSNLFRSHCKNYNLDKNANDGELKLKQNIDAMIINDVKEYMNQIHEKISEKHSLLAIIDKKYIQKRANKILSNWMRV